MLNLTSRVLRFRLRMARYYRLSGFVSHRSWCRQHAP